MTDVQVNSSKDDAGSRLQQNDVTEETGKKGKGGRSRVVPKQRAVTPETPDSNRCSKSASPIPPLLDPCFPPRSGDCRTRRNSLTRKSLFREDPSINLGLERMESREAANESVSGRAASNTVKPNVSLSPAFQARPQGPPGSPRHPLNNGLVGGPRPGGPQPPPQFVRQLDPRSSLGPSSQGQFAQVRPYGPPRPPGGTFSPRPPQPGQNPRFNQSPGVRGPHPQGNRGPLINYQNQQLLRNDPRLQRGHFEPQNGPPYPRSPEGFSPRPHPEGFYQNPQRQLRNESLNIVRQTSEESKQQRPRIVPERMANVDEKSSELQKQTESIGQKKKTEVRENGEKDDDDDVVMDNEKSIRANGETSSDVRSTDDSKSPRVRKEEDSVGSPMIARPSTATIDKSEIKIADAEGKEQAKPADSIDGKTMERIGESSARVDSPKESKTIDDRPTSAKLEEKENEPVKPLTKPNDKIDVPKESEKSKDEKSPVNMENKIEADKHPDKKVESKIEFEKSPAKKEIDAIINDKPKEEDSPKKQETSASKDKTKEDDSLKKTAVDSTEKLCKPEEPPKKEDFDVSKESKPRETTTPKLQEKIDTSETFTINPPIKEEKQKVMKREVVESKEKPAAEAEKEKAKTEIVVSPSISVSDDKKQNLPFTDTVSQEDRKVSPREKISTEESPPKSPKSDGARISESKTDSAATHKPSSEISESEKPSESLRVNGTSISPESTPDKQKLPVPDSLTTPPRSPQEGVKGFDNGQRRSLSSKSSPCYSPQSPVSPKSPKSPKSPAGSARSDGEKKKTTFAEDVGKKEEEKKSPDSKPTSKPTTPTGKSPRSPKLEKEKRESKKEIENGGTSDATQANAVPTTNGVADSPTKKSPSKSKDSDKRSVAGSPTKSPSKSAKSLPRTPETPSSTAQEKKKVPMNKIQVGAAPSPNLKTVRSKIGSLENASYKPGGGKVKIENRKLDFSKAQPKIAAKNEKYTPSGGDKKIAQVKLQWNAKPKVGSLENATYKPGGGDKKIETVKLDFKDKAKPKVGSKDNAKHVPGGGSVKSSATPPKTPQEQSNDIQTQKIDIKAESKVGSLDNVKHKPGGGDKKIFNDREYLRQTDSNVESLSGSGSQNQSPSEEDHRVSQKTREAELPQPPPSTPTRTRTITSPSVVTPRAVRSSLAKSPDSSGKRTFGGENTSEKKEKEESLEGEKRISSTRSPTSPRPPSSLRLKKSPGSPRKGSPKELRLPRLTSSPVSQDTNQINEKQSKITLPKLIEPSNQSTRVAH